MATTQTAPNRLSGTAPALLPYSAIPKRLRRAARLRERVVTTCGEAVENTVFEDLADKLARYMLLPRKVRQELDKYDYEVKDYGY